MTSILKSKEYSILDKKINDLLAWNEVRFVGLISGQGRLVLGGFKEGIKPFVDDAELQKMYRELALLLNASVDEISNYDWGYVPPVSPVWDPLAISAIQVAKKLT